MSFPCRPLNGAQGSLGRRFHAVAPSSRQAAGCGAHTGSIMFVRHVPRNARPPSRHAGLSCRSRQACAVGAREMACRGQQVEHGSVQNGTGLETPHARSCGIAHRASTLLPRSAHSACVRVGATAIQLPWRTFTQPSARPRRQHPALRGVHLDSYVNFGLLGLCRECSEAYCQQRKSDGAFTRHFASTNGAAAERRV